MRSSLAAVVLLAAAAAVCHTHTEVHWWAHRRRFSPPTKTQATLFIGSIAPPHLRERFFPGQQHDADDKSNKKHSRDDQRKTLARVLAMIDERDASWLPVVREGRCRVWQRRGNGRHACVLAKGIVDAPASHVYDLFEDARRAKDFNEYCDECLDVERRGVSSKVSWSATKPIGVFKARDFVTLCHFTQLKDGSKCVVNKAVDHPTKPPSSKYQRAEVVIAANIVKALPDGRSHLTLLTHVNPRGAIDTPLGARIANQLVKRSPVQFFEQVERAARRRSLSSSSRTRRRPFRPFRPLE